MLIKVVFWIVIVLQVLLALGVTALVLLQKGRDAGLSGAVAGGGQQVFGKKRGQDEVLARYTTILAISFGITSLVLTYLSPRM